MTRTILLVDDDEIFHDIHQRLLVPEGHTVLTCYDGSEIADVLAKNQVDLIILDHNMPCMTGVEFLEKRAKNPEWMKIPVMMCTNNSPEHKDFIMVHVYNWVVKFLSKPFLLDELDL